MKRLSIFFLLFLACRTPVPKETMNSEFWIEDINHLENTILDNYPMFTEEVRADFISSLNSIKENVNVYSNSKIMVELGRAVALLRDSHTELNLLQANTKFKRLPFIFYSFGGKLKIIAAHEEYKSYLGCEVIQIGSHTTKEAVSKVEKLIAADNIMEIWNETPNYLTLKEVLVNEGISKDDSNVVMRLKSKDTLTASFTFINRDNYRNGSWILARDTSLTPLYLQHQDKQYWYKIMEDESCMYFKFSRVNNQDGQASIKKVVSRMFAVMDEKNINRLIVDLRNNRGGNYHKAKPLLKHLKKRPSVTTKVITNRVTFSAASVTTIRLKRQFDAKIYGETGRSKPNGSDNVEYCYLPNSALKLGYTNRYRVHWPEMGTIDHVPMDFEISNSYQDYVSGRDRVLEKVINDFNTE